MRELWALKFSYFHSLPFWEVPVSVGHGFVSSRFFLTFLLPIVLSPFASVFVCGGCGGGGSVCVRACVRSCACECLCLSHCVYVSVRACVRACVRVCVCVLAREIYRGRSRQLII